MKLTENKYQQHSQDHKDESTSAPLNGSWPEARRAVHLHLCGIIGDIVR